MGAQSIGERLEGSTREVLQVGVLERIALLPLIRSSRLRIPIAGLVVASPPLIACLVQTLAGDRIGWFTWMTAAIYGLLVMTMVLGARWAWESFIRLGADMDAILGESDRASVIGWLNRALAQTPQALAAVVGVAGSSWVAIKLTGPLGESYLEDGNIAYVITIGWTGGVGALTGYWLWGAPAMFYPLSHTHRPKLDWVAPLQTPAIQKASRLLIESARLASIGLFLFTIPIAITLAVASGEWSVWAMSISPIVFSIATILGCSVLPQIALGDLVRRGKRQTLDVLRPQLPPPEILFADAKPETLEAVTVYERLANTPVSLIDLRRIAEDFLLLLSAAGPILIALLTR